MLTKENYSFLALFFFSAVIVYFAPPIIQKVYFLYLLIHFYRSQKNYLWIAFVFLLMAAPAGFFSGVTADDAQRLPFYSFGKGFSFSFFDLFYFTAIIKSINTGNVHSKYYFNSSLLIVSVYAIFLLIYTLILGMSIPSIIIIGREALFPFLFFVISPRLIKNTHEFNKLIRLLLPFVFLSFLGQIYEISYGKYLISAIKASESTIISTGAAIAEGSSDVSRVFDAWVLNTFSIIFCSFLLIRGNREFNHIYLIILIFLNFFICFTSATRGSFLTYMAILASMLWFMFRLSTFNLKYLKFFFIGLMIGVVGLLALKTSNILSTQIQRSTERIGTLESIIGGDVKSVSVRTEKRIPLLMGKFKERPFFGWGLLRYQDGHIGMHSMLTEGGIMEIIVFAFFFFQIIDKPLKLKAKGGIFLSEINSIKFLSLAFLSLLIVHTTSSQIFGYFIGFNASGKWMMVSLILVGINVYYRQARFSINNTPYLVKK